MNAVDVIAAVRGDDVETERIAVPRFRQIGIADRDLVSPPKAVPGKSDLGNERSLPRSIRANSRRAIFEDAQHGAAIGWRRAVPVEDNPNLSAELYPASTRSDKGDIGGIVGKRLTGRTTGQVVGADIVRQKGLVLPRDRPRLVDTSEVKRCTDGLGMSAHRHKKRDDNREKSLH